MPKISLSGPAELLTVIPYQLGFQPSRSVVVVCFHGKELGLVARLDLIPDGGAPAESGQPVVHDAVADTLPALLRDEPSSMALVGYEAEAGESRLLLDALREAVEDERVIVRERL